MDLISCLFPRKTATFAIEFSILGGLASFEMYILVLIIHLHLTSVELIIEIHIELIIKYGGTPLMGYSIIL